MWRFVFLVLGLTFSLFGREPEYRSMGPDIFDPKAQAEKLIAAALARAQTEDKQVLLLFGANWCPWCRRLHAALTRESVVQRVLRERYVLVFVDANTRNDKLRNAAVLERYGNPVREFGLPVFVLLDRDGKQLATRETASLAAPTGAEVAERVRTMLNAWSS